MVPRGPSSGFQCLSEKRQDAVERRGNHGIRHGAVERMSSPRHPDQFMLNAMARQLPGHQDGLLEWNVLVVLAVKQQSGRVIRGDIAHGT